MENKYTQILKQSTVLLVEDNKGLRKSFKDTLELYVNGVLEASNGEEALAIFNTNNINIVITDVNMPIMDGLMLTTLLRKINSDIPIVIISAYSEKNILLDFISLNLIEYLVKPVDFKQLTTVLNRCAQIISQKGLIEIQLAQNCIYSFSKRSLVLNSKIIPLTTKEIKFLELLIKNKNKLVTKTQVEYEVYDNVDMTTSAINNLVLRLRKKIASPKVIVTINEVGFMIINES